MQDEARFGLKTCTRRRITASGVRSVAPVQWDFQAYWLYGWIEPATGDNFFLEMPHLNGNSFQAALNAFAEYAPNEQHIIQLDQAPAHTIKSLEIPDNCTLFFQPPHCPELNPIEQVWSQFKSQISWHLFPSLDALKEHVAQIICQADDTLYQSITGRQSIMDALRYAGLITT